MVRNTQSDITRVACLEFQPSSPDQYSAVEDDAGALKPQRSLQNRPTMVTSKPANGDDPGRCCSTPLEEDSASPF